MASHSKHCIQQQYPPKPPIPTKTQNTMEIFPTQDPDHARYIKNNNPQSAYALHILNNQHEYGPMEKTMTLLKPVKNTSLLTPYELFFIQAFHKSGRLVSEQNPGEPNPLLQMAINTYHPPSRTVTFTVLAPYNAAPHNRYQPHPAEPGM